MMRRRWVSRVGALCVLTLVVTAAQCPGRKGKATPAVAESSAIPDSADQVAFGAKVVMTNRGVSNGVLLSDTTIIYDDGTRMELRGVNVTFFTSQGIEDGKMTARKGTYNTRLSRLEASGNVIVVRNDGRRLESQQLVYDQARNQIFTDSAFVLNEAARVFTGIGFESDPQMTNFNCLQACKGVAPVKIPLK